MANNLDPEIWSQLPFESIKSVLNWLPLESVARYRSVCKQWKNYLYGDDFLSWRRTNFKEHPWLLLIRNDENKYYRLNVSTNTLKAFRLKGIVLASVGGLVVTTDDTNHIRLYLSNPINKIDALIGITSRGNNFQEQSVIICNPRRETFFQLPVTILNRGHGITFGNILWERHQFDVVAVLNDSMQVYNFSNQRWDILPLPTLLRADRNVVFFKGVYVYTVTRLHDNEDCLMFFGRNLRPGLWWKANRFKSPHLVVCGSELFLITQHSLSLVLCKVLIDQNHVTLRWSAANTMPQAELEFLFPELQFPFVHKSLAAGNYICFVREESGKMVFFNKENLSWSRFAVHDHIGNFRGSVDAYVFEPWLDVSVV